MMKFILKIAFLCVLATSSTVEAKRPRRRAARRSARATGVAQRRAANHRKFTAHKKRAESLRKAKDDETAKKRSACYRSFAGMFLKIVGTIGVGIGAVVLLQNPEYIYSAAEWLKEGVIEHFYGEG